MLVVLFFSTVNCQLGACAGVLQWKGTKRRELKWLGRPQKGKKKQPKNQKVPHRAASCHLHTEFTVQGWQSKSRSHILSIHTLHLLTITSLTLDMWEREKPVCSLWISPAACRPHLQPLDCPRGTRASRSSQLTSACSEVDSAARRDLRCGGRRRRFRGLGTDTKATLNLNSWKNLNFFFLLRFVFFPDATKQGVKRCADSWQGWVGLRELIDSFGGLENGNDISRPHRDTRCAFHPYRSPRKHFWPSVTWQRNASPASLLRVHYVLPHLTRFHSRCGCTDLTWPTSKGPLRI